MKRMSQSKKKSNVLDTANTTNIVYLTTICNLACTYCYEHLDTIKPKNLSVEQLYKVADEAITRESDDEQTQFVLFGGEATLRWNEAEKFMDYAYSKKKNISFNLITNGIRFLEPEFFKQFFRNNHYNTGRLTIDISFDGMDGNIDRIYHSGDSSTKDVVMVFSKLTAHNLRWRLRYTVHKNNINTFDEDILKLIKHFNPERVIKNVAYEQLNKDDLVTLANGFNTLKYDWDVNKKTPICELVCDTCDGCPKTRMQIADYTSEVPDIHSNKTFGEFRSFDSNKKI